MMRRPSTTRVQSKGKKKKEKHPTDWGSFPAQESTLQGAPSNITTHTFVANPGIETWPSNDLGPIEPFFGIGCGAESGAPRLELNDSRPTADINAVVPQSSLESFSDVQGVNRLDAAMAGSWGGSSRGPEPLFGYPKSISLAESPLVGFGTVFDFKRGGLSTESSPSDLTEISISTGYATGMSDVSWDTFTEEWPCGNGQSSPSDSFNAYSQFDEVGRGIKFHQEGKSNIFVGGAKQAILHCNGPCSPKEADIPLSEAKEGGDSPKSVSRRPDNASTARIRSLACPFHKKEPRKYPACGRHRLVRPRDVKQHIYRKHMRSNFYCPICFLDFELEKGRDDHIRKGGCETKTIQKLDGISGDQRKSLMRYAKRVSPEEQWFEIWDIIFPEEPRPSSPYLRNGQAGMITALRKVWNKRGCDIVSSSLQTNQIVGIAPEVIYRVMGDALDRFEDEMSEAASECDPE
ncbi:hypothetical protein F4780DRAFT_714314 [Xylariomycetidae sp. FL0641]|nr:hypothetical protein F4780DRAFT_714314 [Xylariomycetidae sp. FL0641]